MSDHTTTIDEGQRQAVILALAELSIDRPGWYAMLGELAAKYSTAPQLEDGRALFEEFRRLRADAHIPRRRAVISVDPACDEGCPAHVRYIDERGETWDHGYPDLEDLDLQREVCEWLEPARKQPSAAPLSARAPFADLPLTPSTTRKLLRWRDQARGRPRQE